MLAMHSRNPVAKRIRGQKTPYGFNVGFAHTTGARPRESIVGDLLDGVSGEAFTEALHGRAIQRACFVQGHAEHASVDLTDGEARNDGAHDNY